MQNEIDAYQAAATHTYQQGNLPLAELICRNALNTVGGNEGIYVLLGKIALDINMPDFAAGHFQKALQINSANGVAKKHLQLAQQREEEAGKKVERESSNASKYLLIKAWGFGFWSEVDHVLGQLLLAEITGRIPVVHWGSNSLFKDKQCENAYELYFEPVSPLGVHDLLEKPFRYFPRKWTQANLLENDVNKWEGEDSRVAGLLLLNREEDVVVSDFHTYMNDLAPWIRQDHPLYGQSTQQLYRTLFNKYIKLKPDIVEDIEQYWQTWMKDQSLLAVHVRGSDKLIESDHLVEINNAYHGKIDEYLERMQDGRIFLLTDSEQVVAEYKDQYGGRLIIADCTRTGDDTGIHYKTHAEPRSIGTEVIRDVYLAAKCDYFLGNGRSNVSTTVLHLKEWQSEQCTLMGDNMLFQPQFYVHKR